MTSTTNKVRWAPLAASTVILFVGALWLFRRSDDGTPVVALLGAAMATVAAVTALVEHQRHPWPAAIALVGGAPMVLLLLVTGSFRHVLEVNAMAALLLIGSVGTLYTALSVLLRNRRHPVARAVARPRASE